MGPISLIRSGRQRGWEGLHTSSTAIPKAGYGLGSQAPARIIQDDGEDVATDRPRPLSVKDQADCPG